MEARGPPILDLNVPPLQVRVSWRRGRLRGEYNGDATVCLGGRCGWAFSVKAFTGWGPYRGWAEVHTVVRPELYAGPVEDHVLGVLSGWLGPGEKLYVEYVWDPLTTWELDRGVPVQASRIGYKLLAHGFVWQKNWYYPEGFMEGAPKIEGEKPLSRRHMLGQLRSLLSELESYNDNMPGLPASTSQRIRMLKTRIAYILSGVDGEG